MSVYIAHDPGGVPPRSSSHEFRPVTLATDLLVSDPEVGAFESCEGGRCDRHGQHRWQQIGVWCSLRKHRIRCRCRRSLTSEFDCSLQVAVFFNIIRFELQDYVGTDITSETFVIRSVLGTQKYVAQIATAEKL